MSRKYVDCRDHPSVSGCTLAMSGEEDELINAAAVHAARVHGHTDDEELRTAVRADLRVVPVADTEPGAFVQLIEIHTQRVEEVDALASEWAAAIGADRTARWGITVADRDHPNRYLHIVQFPSYQEAMANSTHPATARFAEQLEKLCDEPASFTNLDVYSTTAF